MDLTLLEKSDTLGGLESEFTADGFRFDTGLTWYMMSDVFDRTALSRTRPATPSDA